MRTLEKVRRLFRLSVGLRAGTDPEGTISTITENVRLRGVNIWMLVCSAILASIGLDINSTAVIIGAMLISPLMSPILGVGLGIAILDRNLLRRALNNLAFAAGLGLLTSSIYFFLSPLGELTPELSARTTPTVLDVGVAFFGGVAGIVAGSRRDKTNAMPGVAIATALMPPLCTAGYGLAKLDSAIFLGATYLLFINAVFIAIATYLISIMLRLPRKGYEDSAMTVAVKRFVIGFAIITAIPSALIFYNVLEKLRVERGVKRFIAAECRNDDRRAIQWELNDNSEPAVLKVYMVGRGIGRDEQRRLQEALDDYHIGEVRFKPVQLNVSPEEFKRLNADIDANLNESVKLLQALAEERGNDIDDLRARLEEVQSSIDPKNRFLRDIRVLFPQVAALEWESDQGTGGESVPDALNITFGMDVNEADKRKIIKAVSGRARLMLSSNSLRINERKTTEAPQTDG